LADASTKVGGPLTPVEMSVVAGPRVGHSAGAAADRLLDRRRYPAIGGYIQVAVGIERAPDLPTPEVSAIHDGDL
jgi:hypothetical protein